MVNQIHHRSEEEIVADILTSILDGSKKTRIMYGANLSYALTTKYLSKLLECSLIQYSDRDKKYMLTGAGRKYLERYLECKSIKDKLIATTTIYEEKLEFLIQMLDNNT
jgi:predicted transcriptional regulator